MIERLRAAHRFAVTLLSCSVALIVFATLLPVSGMASVRIPPAWCLRCGTLWLTDVLSNIALFTPFGAAIALLRGPSWRVPTVALLCSVVIESLQSLGIPPGRSPALADIASNTVGGIVGALVIHVLHCEAQRPWKHARRYAVGWTMLTSMVLMATTLALQSGAPERGTMPLVVKRSPFDHVPGHGWYEGITDSARVDTNTIRRGWSGPIMRQVDQPRLPVRVAVWVRSNDPLGGPIPLLFLHTPGDSTAWLQIAKRGDDAELTVFRKAWHWGLIVPSAVVHGAFRGRAVNDQRTLALQATVSPSALTLRASGAAHGTTDLALTPMLGWALVQPVVPVHSRFAWLLAFGWTLVLFAPIGWWSANAPAPLTWSAGIAVLMGCLLVLLPIAGSLHPLRVADWTAVILSFSAGSFVAIASQQRRRRSSGA